MEYVFQDLIPVPWFLADILTVALTVIVVAFAIRRTRHPGMVILECLAFVLLYAGLFENFAVVNGWYVYGRSLLMFGNVPLSVPLLEMDVLIAGLWLLEKVAMPNWAKPFVLGLFGMLQDLSLDPLAVQQVYTVNGTTSGRWTWLLEPGATQMFNIPVYNFPGWMLIMLYGSVFLLAGRGVFKRSGYKPWVGWVYPFLAMLLALITMVTPLSQFLLWLAPVGIKGSNYEWIMLAFHLLFPTLLLIFLWRGRMHGRFVFSADWPLFFVPLLFHLADLFWIVAGGFTNVLGLALLATFVHGALLAWIFFGGVRQAKTADPLYVYSP
ncbi:MAG: hypothetical protein WBM17_03165 [Anaerolineales bacterium]